MPTTDDLSTTRYGRRTRARWVWPAVASVLVGVGVAWVWWVAQAQGGAVSSRLHSYDVTSDHEVVATLQIHRPDGAAAECDVYAQAADHSIVGERVATIPASADEDVLVDVAVTTDRRPVTAVIRSCTLTD